MGLLRGVMAHQIPQAKTFADMLLVANDILKKEYGLKKNDKTIVLAASMGSAAYSTDMIRIYTIV